jgi:hypothetical protein
VDPVPDPLLFRKSGIAGNRTRVLWVSSQELWPLDNRSGYIEWQRVKNIKKNAVFWDITPRGSCNNRTFGWMYLLQLQGDKNRQARKNISSNKQPKHSADIVFLVTLMMEVIHSSETSVLTRVIRRHIPNDGILHSHRRENLKSYKNVKVWV